jgi:hypothetical protein
MAGQGGGDAQGVASPMQVSKTDIFDFIWPDPDSPPQGLGAHCWCLVMAQ